MEYVAGIWFSYFLCLIALIFSATVSILYVVLLRNVIRPLQLPRLVGRQKLPHFQFFLKRKVLFNLLESFCDTAMACPKKPLGYQWRSSKLLVLVCISIALFAG